MSFNKTPTETYANGSSLIRQFSRVVNDSGVLRLAGATELENGVTTRTVLPNTDASVYTTHSQGRYQYLAGGPIASGSAVYRAANGKVASTGTLKVGIAASSASADGESIYVDISISGDSGSSGGSGQVLPPILLTLDVNSNLVQGPPQVVTLPVSVPADATELVIRASGNVAVSSHYSISGNQLTWTPPDSNPLLDGETIEIKFTSGTEVVIGSGSSDPEPSQSIGTASETLSQSSKSSRVYQLVNANIILTANGIPEHTARVTAINDAVNPSDPSYYLEYRLPNSTPIKRILAGEKATIARKQDGTYNWF